MLINFNGTIVPAQQACILCNDRSFSLGHGLFETLFLNKGTAPAFSYHWQRLSSSAALLGIALPFDEKQLRAMITELVHCNNLEDEYAGIRLTLSAGAGARGILPAEGISPVFTLMPFFLTPTKPTFAVKTSSLKKNEHSPSARIKSTSYIDNILAKQEAVAAGFDEAILLNTAGNIADGAITNIFVVNDKKIFTPKVSDGALPGVMRSVLLHELSDSFAISETTCTMAFLLAADELFLSNSLLGIKPVHRLDNREFKQFKVTIAVAESVKSLKFSC